MLWFDWGVLRSGVSSISTSMMVVVSSSRETDLWWRKFAQSTYIFISRDGELNWTSWWSLRCRLFSFVPSNVKLSSLWAPSETLGPYLHNGPTSLCWLINIPSLRSRDHGPLITWPSSTQDIHDPWSMPLKKQSLTITLSPYRPTTTPPSHLHLQAAPTTPLTPHSPK